MNKTILILIILISILLSACTINNYNGYEGNFSFYFTANISNGSYEYTWMNAVVNTTCKSIKYDEYGTFRFVCEKNGDE